MPNDARTVFTDRSFMIAAAVLLVSALGVQTTTQWMRLHFRKLPLPLRKNLQDFDVRALWPYKVVERAKMSSDEEEALGTKYYFQIALEDTGLAGDGVPGKYVNLFVTYYTGDPDQVPHVPEVCYLGGGFDPAGAYDSTLKVPGLGIKGDELPIRVLFFRDGRSIAPSYRTVVYFFSVNGAYLADRQRVRVALADLFSKYAYFSKVELSFMSADKPSDMQVHNVTDRILPKTLRVLVRDHWQDWNEVTRR
jgi:hypothetical protein